MFILRNLRKYIIDLSRIHLDINRNNVGIFNGYNGYSDNIITQYGYFDISVLYYNRRQVIERDPYIYAEMDYFVESTRYIIIRYLNNRKDLVEIAFVNYNKIIVYKIDNTIKSITTYIFPKHTDETSKWYNKITTVILNDKYLKYEYVGNYQRRPDYGNTLNNSWNVVHRVKYNKHTKLPVYSEYINEGYYRYQQVNPKHAVECHYDKYGRAKKYRVPSLGLLQRI